MVRYQFQIDDETWNDWKHTVDRDISLDQALRQLIEANATAPNPQHHRTPTPTDETPTDPDPAQQARERPTDTAHDDATADAIDDALDGWTPGQAGHDRQQRREIGRDALEWLRDRDAPAARSDFQRELYEDTHLDGQGEKSWWERLVRQALQHARDAELVEYQHGRHEYRWVGGE